MPNKICSCIHTITDPIIGFFQNLIHSEAYFAKMKVSDIQELSHRVLNRYNEKNFTALSTKGFTEEQVVYLDNKHLKYWVKLKQVEDIAHFLSRKQLLYVIQKRGFFTEPFFKQLTFDQFKHLIAQSSFNLALSNDLKKSVAKMDFADWKQFWDTSLTEKEEDVSTFLLENISDAHYADFIKTASVSSLNRMIELAEKKSFPHALKKLKENFSGTMAAYIETTKPDLKEHLPWIRFALNSCKRDEIQELYTNNAKLIHDTLSLVSEDEIQLFLINLPPKVLVHIMIYASQHADDGKLLKNAVAAAKIHKDTDGVEAAFAIINDQASLNLDDMRLILEHFPYHHHLIKEEIIQILEDNDLSEDPAVLPLDKLTPEQIRIVITYLVVEENDHEQIRDNVGYIFNNYDAAKLVTEVFKKLGGVEEQTLCLQYLYNSHASDISPDDLTLSGSQWIKIFESLEDKDDKSEKPLFDKPTKALFSWVILKLKDQKILENILQNLDPKKAYPLIKKTFLSMDESKQSEILSLSSSKLVMRLVQKLLDMEDEVAVAEKVILGISVDSLRNLFNDATVDRKFKQALLKIYLKENHKILNELLNNLANPLAVLGGLSEITPKQMLQMAKNLNPNKKMELDTLLKSDLTYPGYAKLGKEFKLLLPLAIDEIIAAVPGEDLTEMYYTMSEPQLKKLWEDKKKILNSSETKVLDFLIKLIHERSDLNQGNLYFSLFKSLPKPLEAVNKVGALAYDEKTLNQINIALISTIQENEFDAFNTRFKSLSDKEYGELIFNSLKNDRRDGASMAKLILTTRKNNAQLLKLFPIKELKDNAALGKVKELFTPFIDFCLENLDLIDPPANVKDEIDYAEELHNLIKAHFPVINNWLFSWKKNYDKLIKQMREKFA